VAVAAWVGKKRYEVGAPSFMKAWFSTIYLRLEKEKWGSLFPTIMLEFYSGKILHIKSNAAIKELTTIRAMFAELSPDKVIWDFEKPNNLPPWGEKISPTITSLASYFVTSDGNDLFDVLLSAFTDSDKRKLDVIIT
jgi:2,3-bisphosphoglycerate-dependent phosphoglycerate mutase